MSVVLMLALLTPMAAEHECALQLAADLQQGQLVRARAPAGSQVYLGERSLRLAPDGQFVFGLGRDHPPTLKLFISTPAGCMSAVERKVRQREYAIERVSGLPTQTVNPDPATAARIAAESARIREARELASDALHWAGSWQWPATGRISGVYGSQRVLNGEPKDPHLGLDVAAPVGTAVNAPLAGTVRLVATDMVLTGGTLLIDHGFGVSTIYIHLSRIDVREGQDVQAGQLIAAVGATGRASGPHLHFQVHWFQEKLDPALLLPERR